METRRGSEERPHEIKPDPRESPFELPPIEGLPFADDSEEARATRRVTRAGRPRARLDTTTLLRR